MSELILSPSLLRKRRERKNRLSQDSPNSTSSSKNTFNKFYIIQNKKKLFQAHFPSVHNKIKDKQIQKGRERILEEELEKKHGKNNGLEKLTGIITGLSASQRQLTSVALDLQSLALSKKHQIKEQIELADDLGEVLEVLIHLLKEATDEFAECHSELES